MAPAVVEYGIALTVVAVELYIVYDKYVETSTYTKSTPDSEWTNPFLETSFTPPVVMTALYLLFVLFLGPNLMSNREPINTTRYMLIYNAYQTVFNVCAVCLFLWQVISRGMPLVGTEFDPNNKKEYWIAFTIWMHYQNKYIEQLDTVFMVLRKKTKQITSLHVSHHSEMSWAWLFVLRNNPGGDPFFGALANSFIHVVMYSYYLTSSLKLPGFPKASITQLQLLQFVCVFVQGSAAIYYGTCPTWLVLIQQFIMLQMLYMFGKFYYDSYVKKGKKAD